MSEPDLLVTRFTIPPVRSGLLQRSHLLATLDQSRSFPLTLLSASAGFGKTTLLSAWAGQHSEQVAWLSLDSQDNDPARFWSYVIAAIRKVDLSIGLPAEALLHSAQPSLLTSALTALVNELAEIPRDIFLILDDYHLIREQTVHASLLFVLEHLPANLHLLLSSRVDPTFPLARLRARGQVAEIREADLRLNNEEAAHFLKQIMGLTLNEEEVGHLEARTEGWITGLQLAALSLRRHADTSAFLSTFTGSHRFILDYVQGEILAALPEQQQRFLLSTSILTRLNAEICQVLTGEAGSQEILEELERANLFLLPLDEERRWYRFHTLFREVLLARLQATQPEQVVHLHREAALWYQSQGWLNEAIPHALATREYPFAAELLEACIERLSQQGELKTLLAWIKQIPAAVLREYPRLVTTYLLVFNLLFPFTQQEQEERAYLRQLQEGVEQALQNASIPEAERDRLRQRVAILDAWKLAKKALSAGDMAQLNAIADQLQPPELEDDALWQQSGLAPFAITWRMAGNFPPMIAAIQKLKQRARRAQDRSQEVHILWGLIAAQIASGQLQEASTCCQELQQLISSLQVPAPLAAYPALFQAQLAYAWNQLEAARDAALEAIQKATPFQYMDILMGAYEMLVRVNIASGELSAAHQALSEMEQVNQSSGIPLFQPWIEGLRSQLWLAQGDLASAADWAEYTPYRQEALAGGVYSREGTYLTLVRVYLAQHRYQQVLQLLAALLAGAEQVSRVGSIVAILALQTAALQMSGDTQEALQVLVRLLPLAEPERYLRVFLDAGTPMQQVLRAWLRTEQEAVSPALLAYVQSILTAFTSEQQMVTETRERPMLSGQPRQLSPSIEPLLEPLTPRELDVLRLLAEGTTNQEIAERLVISLTTVKKHVSSLFLKLAAENRTHAVARARELSLL